MGQVIPFIDAKALVSRWKAIGGSFRLERNRTGSTVAAFPVIHPGELETSEAQALVKRLLRPQVNKAIVLYLAQSGDWL